GPISSAGGPAYLTFGYGTVWTGREMLVWGGGMADHNWRNKGGGYDPGINNWGSRGKVNSPRLGLYGLSAVWIREQDRAGGANYSDVTFPPTQGSRYNPAHDSWTRTSSNDALRARTSHTAVWTGNEMLVWGGRSNYGGPPGDMGGRYDPVLDIWRPMTLENA